MALSYVIHDVHIKKYLDDKFDKMKKIIYGGLRDRTEPILKAEYLRSTGTGTGVFLIV